MSIFVFFISLLIVAQHVSGNHVPIIRSWRLRDVIASCWYVPWVREGGQVRLVGSASMDVLPANKEYKKWHPVGFLIHTEQNTPSCRTIQITSRCQARGANMAARSGSHLPSTGVWETDFLPRHVPQQRRWLRGKISEVKCNKWIKMHLTMWGYLVTIK